MLNTLLDLVVRIVLSVIVTLISYLIINNWRHIVRMYDNFIFNLNVRISKH